MTEEPGAKYEIIKPSNGLDAVCDRLVRLGIPPRDRNRISGQVVISDSQGRYFLVVDILDRLIGIIEQKTPP
jgi:hypothetical protein